MPDENYAREILQLFSIGLVELEMDGTPKPGAPETYDNEDITGLARVFTGLSGEGASFKSRDQVEDYRYRPLQMFDDQLSLNIPMSRPLYHDSSFKDLPRLLRHLNMSVALLRCSKLATIVRRMDRRSGLVVAVI